MAQASQSRADGLDDVALAKFGQALEENPNLTAAHLGMGDIFRERETYSTASNAYRRAILSDPNNFDARYYFGLTAQIQGKLDQAIASYQRALVIRPESFIANRDMAAAYIQSGNPSAAVAFAEKAVELDSESQMAWANLAVAYYYTGEFLKAVEAYRQTLELGDVAVPILLGLADSHIRLGNYQRAENVLRAVVREDPSDEIAQERLAVVLFRQQRFKDSLEAYERVLAINSEDTASLNGIGVTLMALYLEGGENDEKLRHRALAGWRRSLELRPGQAMLIDLISRYSKE